MDASLFGTAEVVTFTVIAGVLFYVIQRFFTAGNSPEVIPVDDSTDDSKAGKDETETSKSLPKPKKISLEKRKEVKDQYTHPWLLSNLKGHSGQILDLDFNSSGKYLASCADDRSVMLWSAKTFHEKNHKSFRANVEYDHATRVKWSPDGKAFIACVANGNTIQVHRVGKKKDGSLGNIEVILKFPELHQADIINIGIACNGQFIMSCSSDTTLVVWDLKGKYLL